MNKLNIDLSLDFLPPLLFIFIILRSLLLPFSSPSIQICLKKCRQSLLAAISDRLLAPILPATLPRSIYFFRFVIFSLFFRALIAFGYFFQGFGRFNISEYNRSLGFIFILLVNGCRFYTAIRFV